MHRQNYEELFKKFYDKFSERFEIMKETYVTFFKVKFEQEQDYA